MPLYFIRHGESRANEQNRFAGRLDAPLTTLGLRQADQAAGRVAALAASGVHIDEVHTSTLRRAQESAGTIIERLPEPPDRVTIDEALIERDFGIYNWPASSSCCPRPCWSRPCPSSGEATTSSPYDTRWPPHWPSRYCCWRAWRSL